MLIKSSPRDSGSGSLVPFGGGWAWEAALCGFPKGLLGDVVQEMLGGGGWSMLGGEERCR